MSPATGYFQEVAGQCANIMLSPFPLKGGTTLFLEVFNDSLFNVVMWQIGNTPDGPVRTLRSIRSIQKCSEGTQHLLFQCDDFGLQHSHHCWMLSSQLLISGLALQDKAVHFDKP